jgi:hypothetical protein
MASGFLRAQQQGINLIDNPAAVLDEEEEDEDVVGCIRRSSWLDYGTEGYRQRPTMGPQDDDPYVEVTGVLDGAGPGVGDYLATPGIQRQMGDLAGPAWPIPADYGVARYKLVRDKVYDEIRSKFPGYLNE